MFTCEYCQFYTPDEVEDDLGVCEILECMVNENELPCKRFTEKESD